VGDWCSLTAEEIRDRFPGMLEEYRAGRLRQPPGGEAEETMAARILGAMGRLAGRPGGPLLVVTHGGVIRLLDRRLGREPLRAANLCGRWFEPRGNRLVPGQAMELPDLPDPDDQTAAAVR
jgi:broad specificity phosphatase PhoE